MFVFLFARPLVDRDASHFNRSFLPLAATNNRYSQVVTAPLRGSCRSFSRSVAGVSVFFLFITFAERKHRGGEAVSCRVAGPKAAEAVAPIFRYGTFPGFKPNTLENPVFILLEGCS